MKLTNKGAMFGLDARIALAIFGALSVISGAALYSAIQESKAISLLNQLEEFGKAWEQFYLDTGSEISLDANTTCGLPCHYKVAELVESTGSDWKGPYISFIKQDDYTLKNSSGNSFTLVQTRNDVSWGVSTNWNANTCQSGSKCSVWIISGAYDNDSLFKLLDKKIDLSDGAENGSIRWRKNTNEWKDHIFFEYIKIKNPND
ncbi:MAG: hypothetical protein CFH44_00964 [Proteobacteria bacterium]|nr:MAG: hypothetical protein CFH44_00964 [Pseudomonadota bacterium]|tara:strand:+ start:52 stop:660 length:609 start_codon:yes stop_codon:yes gene_type:complete